MTPEQLENVKTNARIVAIESVLVMVLAALSSTPAARKAILAKLDQLVATTDQVRFPWMTPEYSDLVAAEGREATEQLVSFLKKVLNR